MRNPLLPPIMLLLLAAALYLLPDGSFYAWRLYLGGTFARLSRPPEPRPDASEATFFEPRDLLDILAQKDAEIADLNRRLREIGIARDKVARAKIIPSRVVRLGPDNNLDTFTIDTGSVDGVVAGQAVVVGQSLVGVVVKSEANAALVLSLSSTGCYISARLGEPEGSTARPRQLCAVRGAGGGRVRIIAFSSDVAAQEGWLAMTSGLEKAVPEGILVGTVAGRFEEGSENGTMEADLRPSVDLSSLDFVTVVSRE